jgi:hypothetical protein
MRRTSLIGLVTVIAIVFPANADIIDWDAADDGDGAIVCTTEWDEITYELFVDGVQYWDPGHVLGYFTTDTEADPTVWFRNSVVNEYDIEPLVWTDYHITMTMNKTFNILAADTMDDWSYSYTPTATYDPDLALWVGTVDYVMDAGGEPIDYLDEGQFDFQVSFVGSVTFCQEMVPTPEPSGLLILGLGALLLRRPRP